MQVRHARWNSIKDARPVGRFRDISAFERGQQLGDLGGIGRTPDLIAGEQPRSRRRRAPARLASRTMKARELLNAPVNNQPVERSQRHQLFVLLRRRVGQEPLRRLLPLFRRYAVAVDKVGPKI